MKTLYLYIEFGQSVINQLDFIQKKGLVFVHILFLAERRGQKVFEGQKEKKTLEAQTRAEQFDQKYARFDE